MTPKILPLLWFHGESFDILEEEIREMYNAGLRGFIAEARPFPGYMEEDWWKTLEFILSLAEKLGMKVMLFDDSHFPSGYADGKIAEKHPEHLRLLLEPLKKMFSHPGGIFQYDPEQYLQSGDKKIAKVYLLAMNRDSTFQAKSVRNLPCVKTKLDLPPGNYMLNIWKITRNGGEAHTRNYINFLSPEAVKCYIDTVYFPHVERLKRFIGKSFIGFFSDEPRLANAESYEAPPGNCSTVCCIQNNMESAADRFLLSINGVLLCGHSGSRDPEEVLRHFLRKVRRDMRRIPEKVRRYL